MYEAAEAEHRGDCNYDIVLVGSDFLEKVKPTHGSYFDTSVKRFSERSRRLALASGVTAARSISNQRRNEPRAGRHHLSKRAWFDHRTTQDGLARAGMSKHGLTAAHNRKVAGSNPAPLCLCE